MVSQPAANHFNDEVGAAASRFVDRGLQHIIDRLSNNLKRDSVVQTTTRQLRELLQVDRVVVYYFYSHWRGRVTFEALSGDEFSIYGSTGPDECFNGEYAALYEAGRVRAIADIETEPIQACHRDFLRRLQVRANLVVPVLTHQGLWGLLIAHHCQAPRPWLESEIAAMRKGAETLATATAIRTSQFDQC